MTDTVTDYGIADLLEVNPIIHCHVSQLDQILLFRTSYMCTTYPSEKEVGSCP